MLNCVIFRYPVCRFRIRWTANRDRVGVRLTVTLLFPSMSGARSKTMMTKISTFLYWTPAYVLVLVFLPVLLIAVEAGYRIGARMRVRRGAVAAPELGTIQTAMLALLGLLLAFTYSFVASRRDARKDAVVEEANAMGTAYLRTQLMPDRTGDQLRDLVRDYARTRLVTVRSEEELQAALDRSQQVMGELWPTAVKLVEGRTPTPVDALLLQSLNEVLDVHTRRLTAAHDRLPGIILAMLVAIALMSLGMTGFSGGLAGQRALFFTITLAVMVAAVTLVIIDLDRPRSGFVRVSQQPLIDVLEIMDEADTPVRVREFDTERKVSYDNE